MRWGGSTRMVVFAFQLLVLAGCIVGHYWPLDLWSKVVWAFAVGIQALGLFFIIQTD